MPLAQFETPLLLPVKDNPLGAPGVTALATVNAPLTSLQLASMCGHTFRRLRLFMFAGFVHLFLLLMVRCSVRLGRCGCAVSGEPSVALLLCIGLARSQLYAPVLCASPLFPRSDFMYCGSSHTTGRTEGCR